jgi:7-cyano-7-deazaguanine synthase
MLSGGIDSTTALYWALNKGYDLIALSLNYKWRPKKEIEAVKKLTEINEVKLVEVPIPYIMESTDLRLEGYPSPSSTNAPEGYIPLKNLLFYSISAYFADIYGANYVIGGHHKDDFQDFPDSTPTFFKNLGDLIKNSKHEEDNHEISFIFPFVEKSKKEIIDFAHELDVPIDLTWSCYGDFEEPCGKCNPCIKRAKAIEK